MHVYALGTPKATLLLESCFVYSRNHTHVKFNMLWIHACMNICIPDQLKEYILLASIILSTQKMN